MLVTEKVAWRIIFCAREILPLIPQKVVFLPQHFQFSFEVQIFFQFFTFFQFCCVVFWNNDIHNLTILCLRCLDVFNYRRWFGWIIFSIFPFFIYILFCTKTPFVCSKYIWFQSYQVVLYFSLFLYLYLSVELAFIILFILLNSVSLSFQLILF